MKYRLIGTDFDGTLLNSKKQISLRNLNTIKKYRDNGYFVVGVTARNLMSVKNVCDVKIFDYLVLNNGGYLFNPSTNEITNFGKISSTDIQNLTDYFKEITLKIDYCTLNHYYTITNDLNFNGYSKKINNLDEIDEDVIRINLFFCDTKNILKYKEYIENNFNGVYVYEMFDTDTGSTLGWLSVNPVGIDKFETIKSLCQKLNISTDEVIFFGDSTNDLPIINKVGLGVAMGNALDEVKLQAKEVTLTNDEDGVSDFLDKL